MTERRVKREKPRGGQEEEKETRRKGRVKTMKGLNKCKKENEVRKEEGGKTKGRKTIKMVER